MAPEASGDGARRVREEVAPDRAYIEFRIGRASALRRAGVRRDPLAAVEEGGRVVGIFGIIDVDRQGSGPRKPPPEDLTPRQYEVLRLLARGSSTAQIAESLSLSRETVRNHVPGLLSALRVNSRIEALIEGRRRGLID